MPQVKLSVIRGKPNATKDVLVAAGTAGTYGTDTIDINIDSTKITKGDAMLMLEEAKQKIFASKWPMA